MQQSENCVQLTFHYLNGHVESFHIYQALGENAASDQQAQLEIRQLLDKQWWILNLPEQTVFINTANLLKVEAKPPLAELHGREVFSKAERITALTRMAQVQ